mmetsp:Transcript_9132/g.21941  ORF Transcript_9132/g.21941 Transcript_9132/m.21941 type:complete len:642 (+) Transcript_9132:17-1942(+)
MSQKAETTQLLQLEEGAGNGWPVQQPAENPTKLFCCPWIFCVPIPAVVLYFVANLGIYVVAALMVGAGIMCCLPACCTYVWLWFWRCWPGFWSVDLYEKLLYVMHLPIKARTQPKPVGPECMPVSGLAPKEVLPKGFLDYALNLRVPFSSADEFGLADSNKVQGFVERSLTHLPQSEHFETFGPNENPVEFVMNQLSALYPPVYQEWPDKLSDTALVRFCLHGLAAHRLEKETRDGQKFWVVRTNALSGLPVRDGFERYGGDVYFDQSWKPVMILDNGIGPLREDGVQKTVTTRPGDPEWERAKFRFRSSLFTLVTLVDHLYDIHLQKANLFVTALREQMSADHPIRRLMAPFTYKTISVNDNAFHNLITTNGMAPRCFAFTEQGFNLALAAAPSLILNGMEVPAEEGGPILFRSEYVAHLKKKGIDTTFWRQVAQLYEIFHRFVLGYLECYYPRKEDLVNDAEMHAMARQYFFQLETVPPNMLGAGGNHILGNLSPSVEESYSFYAKWLAQIMFWVTAGHEQAGGVEVYAQDASWTAFRWVPGAAVGTKQAATATALLMSFTNLPMPQLLGGDFTHLFPTPPAACAGSNPKAVFQRFQDELHSMADECDAYNAASASRKFPENFPMYVNNPRVLEVSVSL